LPHKKKENKTMKWNNLLRISFYDLRHEMGGELEGAANYAKEARKNYFLKFVQNK
jgi:hypothetical protein